MVIANLRKCNNAQGDSRNGAASERQSAEIRCSLGVEVYDFIELDKVPVATKKLGLLLQSIWFEDLSRSACELSFPTKLRL